MSHQQAIRRTQHSLDVPYTDAKRRVDSAGDAAKAIMEKYGCDFTRALDFVVIDRELVEREMSWHNRYVGEGACESCGGPNVWLVGKKGDADDVESKYCRVCQANNTQVECISCGRGYLDNEGGDDLCSDCTSELQYKIDND